MPSAAQRRRLRMTSSIGKRRTPARQEPGLACGAVVGIDIDVEHKPTVNEIERIAFEVFGETPFIRVGRAPREMLVYRAAERIQKQSFTGLDILAAGSQFVAYAIHPEGHLYDWIGDESPLTARPSDAPAVTGEQVAEFISRVSRVIELTKAGSRTARRAGAGAGDQTMTADANGKIVDGRDTFLSLCVYRAIVDLDATDDIAPKSARYHDTVEIELVARLAWERFCNGAVLNVGGKVIEFAEAIEKARGKLNAYAQRRLPFQTKAALNVAKPAYDISKRVPLPDAEAEQDRQIRATIDVMRYRGLARRTREVGASPPPDLKAPLLIGSTLVASETGLGKSEVAIQATAAAVHAGANIAMAVETVALAKELAERFPHGVARVWYGREQPDPMDPAQSACRRPGAANLSARARGEKAVSELVCGRGKHACPLMVACYYQRQLREARSGGRVIWIFTHAALFLPKPKWLGRLDGLIIDESFWKNAIGRRCKVDAGWFQNVAPIADVGGFAEGVARLLDEPGFVTREAMARAGLAHELARDVEAAARAEIRDVETDPTSEESDVVKALGAYAEHNRDASDLADFAADVRAFLDPDGDFAGVARSGRFRVYEDSGARVLAHTPFKPIDPSWLAETLALDADPPPADLLRAILPTARLVYNERIRVRLPDAVEATQIVGAPSSSRSLGLGWRGKSDVDTRAIDRTLMSVIVEAPRAARWVGFIAQKEVEERLTAAGLPDNVTTLHYGKVAGFDGMKNVDTLIVWGRTQPAPPEVESIVGCYTGVAPACAPDGAFYPRVTAGIALATGEGVATAHYRHPDPRCEAVRASICEGGVIQAIGRARYLRRNDSTPLRLILVSDVPTGFPMSKVMS